MSARLLIIILLSLASCARATENIQSQSRQFTIFFANKHVTSDRLPANTILVEPEFLAITAERVKQALAAELPALASYRKQINLYILEQSSPDNAVGIESTHFTDGWNYRMAIPPVVDQTRLVKALINVLLLEYANRSAERGAEIPAWVREGLAQQLFYSVGPKLVVDRTSTAWEGAPGDMQRRTRETLLTNSTPSFNDLTTLAPPPAGAPAEPLYQSGVHLLVRSLLQLPNGRQKFANFLQNIPKAWNWQTSFREAFNFERMLDIEKWWSLVTVEFTTRDQRQAWSPNASLDKLDELLATRVEYRSSTNALPEIRLLDLQSTLRDNNWEFQQTALNEKIIQLGLTSPHLSPQIGALAFEYKKILESYILKRQRAFTHPTLRTTPEAYQQTILNEALRQIQALDAKRRALADPTVSVR